MIKKKKIDKIENGHLSKLLYINFVIILGLLISVFTVIIKKALNIPAYSIINPGLKFNTDFNDVLIFSAGLAGEDATGNYFPFTYVFMKILEYISLGNYKLIYYITFFICIITSFWFCIISLKSKISKGKLFINVLIFICLQFPMIFVFQRGNIEILILTFCILFYVLYKKEKYNLAAIVLSFAVSMKLYPALLAMLFITKKQYKSFFLCAGMSLGLTIVSFIIMQDTLGGLSHYLSGFTKFIDIYGNLQGMQYNHSILFGIYYMIYIIYGVNGLFAIFNTSIINIYTIIIVCIAIPLIIYITFNKMEDWKKLTILMLIIVSFPQISFEYTLILLIIPIIEFIGEKTPKNLENNTYSILFRLIINTDEYKRKTIILCNT